jgi:hypothetical protein
MEPLEKAAVAAISIIAILLIGAVMFGAFDDSVAPPKNEAARVADQLLRDAHACQSVKYLAERRKIADFTIQDLNEIAACKEKGLY